MSRLVLALCLLALAACSPGAAPPTDQPQGRRSDAMAGPSRRRRPPHRPPPRGDAPHPLRPRSPTSFDRRAKAGQRLENGGTALTILTTTLTTQLDPAVPAKAGETYLVANVLLEDTGTDRTPMT